MRFPAASWRDATKFLDVDVDQFAGPVALVSDRGGLGRSDQLAGQGVAVVESRDSIASQDPGDRSSRDTDFVGELVRSATVLATGREHLVLDVGRGLVR
jgi:hypothetical protein